MWALLFVAVFGPGPLAGTVAIACRSVGFVGKLLGEALEEVPGPIEALKAAGSSPVDYNSVRLLAGSETRLLVDLVAALGHQHS